jgi:hypothetical protein
MSKNVMGKLTWSLYTNTKHMELSWCPKTYWTNQLRMMGKNALVWHNPKGWSTLHHKCMVKCLKYTVVKFIDYVLLIYSFYNLYKKSQIFLRSSNFANKAPADIIPLICILSRKLVIGLWLFLIKILVKSFQTSYGLGIHWCASKCEQTFWCDIKCLTETYWSKTINRTLFEHFSVLI